MILPRFIRSIAFRLIAQLTAVVAIVSGIFGYANARIQEEEMLEELVRGAEQLSRSIEGATWNAMLADRREAAYEVMRTIGEKQGIDDIRFFNKEGEVTFSTDPDTASHVDKNTEACFMCHEREQPLIRVDVPSRSRTFSGPDGGRKLAMVTPIYNEPACSNADCHAHPESRSVLGVLDVAMDIDHIDVEVAGVKQRSFWMSVIQVVLIAGLIVLFTRRSVTRPIRELIKGTKAVSHMNLDRPVATSASAEISELEDSFNMMRVRLKTALEELNELNQNLERKVEERSCQLSVVRDKLVRADRLASLGSLAASVAHEINNPVSGVLNFTMLMRRIIGDGGVPEDRLDEFKRYLEMISDETARVGRIVSDLLAFSRRSSPTKAREDLNGIIGRTVSIVSHKLEVTNVELQLELGDGLPLIPCDKSQVQQVVINLLMNAAEAIEGEGRILVRTSVAAGGREVELEVTDNGPGIPRDVRERIFDPFVSTKEEGAGVGLGLSVVYGIVEAHGGVIEVESLPGEGASFRVLFTVDDAGTGERSADGTALASG